MLPFFDCSARSACPEGICRSASLKLCTEYYSGARTAKELDLEVSLAPSYQDKDPAMDPKAKEPSFVEEGYTPIEVYLSYP